jgi:tRNA(Arg) A34 adenosine deaminase TadA
MGIETPNSKCPLCSGTCIWAHILAIQQTFPKGKGYLSLRAVIESRGVPVDIC